MFRLLAAVWNTAPAVVFAWTPLWLSLAGSWGWHLLNSPLGCVSGDFSTHTPDWELLLSSPAATACFYRRQYLRLQEPGSIGCQSHYKLGRQLSTYGLASALFYCSTLSQARPRFKGVETQTSLLSGKWWEPIGKERLVAVILDTSSYRA